MVYDEYTKLRILRWYQQGFRPPTIKKMLEGEGIHATREGVAKFIKRFLRTGTLIDLTFWLV